MNERMKTHVQVVAWLNIVGGAIGVLIGIFLFSILTAIGITAHNSDANTTLPIVGTVLGYFLVFVSAPDIIAGIFLLKFKNWARYLAIVISFFDLFAVPIGTAIAVYSLWVLFNQDTVQMFEDHEAAQMQAQTIGQSN